MSSHFLAHLNVVRPTAPFSPESPEVIFFFSQLQSIFAAAHESPGLKWHAHGARGPDGSYVKLEHFFGLNTTHERDNPHVMTMAGWDSFKSFHSFAYRNRLHVEGMKTLRHWIDRSEGPTLVLWWAPAGHHVTLEEGWERLARLRKAGPSQDAFTLQDRYDAPNTGMSGKLASSG